MRIRIIKNAQAFNLDAFEKGKATLSPRVSP